MLIFVYLFVHVLTSFTYTLFRKRWTTNYLTAKGKRCSSQLSSPASQLPTTWRRRRYRREMTWALIIRARTILAALHQNRPGCDTWLRLLRLLKTFRCFTRTSFFKLTKLKLKSLYMLNKRCSVLKPNLGNICSYDFFSNMTHFLHGVRWLEPI